ncbi:hypothetical protein N0A02_26415 [Paraburkholderia acidicola]|uniref:Uncharacterized protein n=1 Tax=Paraburkholderia acidicola TaxID=1912599 RepID=A0ABV1LUS1_9BURK
MGRGPRCLGWTGLIAGVLNVELIEGDHLAEMLALHPMKRGELERFLLTGWGSA